MRAYAFLVALFLIAQPLMAAVLTNDSVVKMVEAGLDEEVILLAVERGEPKFDLDPSDLIKLKEKGVPDAVVKAMLERQEGAAVKAPAKVADKPASKAKPKVVEIDLPKAIEPKPGNEYYTRFSFRYERGKHITTNYGRGMVLPINTRVKLVSIGGDDMVLEVVDSGTRITIENVEDYSGQDIKGIASRMLSEKETPIEKFDDSIESAIRAGELRLGMTKQQAILARGYPPAHATASTEADVWKYWSSRFVTQTIVFRDGVLAEGRGLF